MVVSKQGMQHRIHPRYHHGLASANWITWNIALDVEESGWQIRVAQIQNHDTFQNNIDRAQQKPRKSTPSQKKSRVSGASPKIVVEKFGEDK